MTIKILGGLAKSRSLFIPKGKTTRPTSVLLKRRVFDAYQSLEGYSFVDLCAGSGAMGIEAWSRGASEVILVENHIQAIRCIEQNIKVIKEYYPDEWKERPIKLVKGQAENWSGLKGLAQKSESIYFFDPPYEDHKLYERVGLPLLEKRRDYEVWIESDKQKGLKEDYWHEQGFFPQKVYSQGTSYLAIFRD